MANLLAILAQPFQPPIRTLRHYNRTKLRRDVLAGLTVSVVEVPQAMAYALIAGVPPQYGLYTSIIQGIIGALLSSSEHLTTGPTNTQSLLIASTVTRVVAAAGPLTDGQSQALYLQLVFGLAMLKGIIQLAFAAAQMGNMVRYVSRSVILGVAAGAGVLIVVGQVPHFLGISLHGAGPPHLPGVLGSLEQLWPRLEQANWRAAALGAGCLAVALGAGAVSRFVPGSLLALVFGAAVVAGLGWNQGTVPTVQSIDPTLPRFAAPWITWSQAEAMFSGALALALLGMLESVAIVKTIAAQTGARINPNQEFFAQGFKNLVSSFLQCIPGSGSFTRTALDYAAGAATRFAAVFNALFVAAIFLLFGSQARYIPLASLAAVLFVIAYGLIDWRYALRVFRSSRPDALVFVVTFLATILAPLQYAIYLGIFLNLALYLRQAAHLHMAEMVAAGGAGRFIEQPVQDRTGQKQVVFLQLEGDLFFATADELQEQLSRLAGSQVRVVILRLKRTHSIDATVLHVLEQFMHVMQSRGGHVLLCGLRPDLVTTLRRYGLVDLIGRDNVFQAESGVFTSAKRALERAKHLVGSSIDAAGLDFTDEPESWAYVI